MGTYSLELQTLRRIPKKYRKDPDKVWPEQPAGLDRAYNDAAKLEDAWHVKLITLERYCSMDELKTWLHENHPDLVLSPSWSMTGGTYGSDVRVTDYTGRTITIPNGIYENLKTDHADASVYEIVEDAWSVDLGYNQLEWLNKILPCYVDARVLKKLLDGRVKLARESDTGGLQDRISDTGYTGNFGPDVIGALADGMEYAKRNGCVLRARIVD